MIPLNRRIGKVMFCQDAILEQLDHYLHTEWKNIRGFIPGIVYVNQKTGIVVSKREDLINCGFVDYDDVEYKICNAPGFSVYFDWFKGVLRIVDSAEELRNPMGGYDHEKIAALFQQSNIEIVNRTPVLLFPDEFEVSPNARVLFELYS